MHRTRVVSLLASGTEILYALGLGESVVGVSHECDFPPDVVHKPRLTRTRVAVAAASGQIDQQVRRFAAAQLPLYEIDVNLLRQLRPDLIVTQAQCDVCAVRYADVLAAVQSHGDLASTQVVSLNPQSLADIYRDVLHVGRAAGCTPAAEQLVQQLQRRVSAVRERTAGLSQHCRPRVVALEWLDPIMLAGNWMPELIDLAGGWQNLVPAGSHSQYANWPRVVAFDPQVIVLMPCGFDLERTLGEAAALNKLQGWQGLSAVQQGRVYAADGNAYFNRSGPRMVDSLEILSHWLQPDLFAAPALAAKVWERLEAPADKLHQQSLELALQYRAEP
jgi:iron complex transport system substrate-binding protein